jgi:RNase P/RNase MRP subunit POP5
VLNRRVKRRYVSVVYTGSANKAVNAIIRRCSDLFGSIATEKAGIRLVRSDSNVAIIKCRQEQLDNVLAAIALLDPPVVTRDISGSIKQLRRRLA